MRNLIVARHSLPEIDPSVPSNRWRLSGVGRLRAKRLADMLAGYNPSAIVTSPEPKAVETGDVISRRLSIPAEIVDGLREHDREKEGFAGSDQEFAEKVALFFENPDSLVFGSETADQANNRFAKALSMVQEQHPEGNLVVVTHGTMMTLFVSRATGMAPYQFWRRLGAPSFVVMSIPSLELLRVVEDVESGGDG